MFYSLSKEFENNILKVAKNVEMSFNGLLKFDEYTVLVDYGAKAVLRFGIMHNDIDDISKLDEIECKIRGLLGEDYYGNLLGQTYEVFGFNREVMERGTKVIDQKVTNDLIKYKETSYGKYIKNDGDFLREVLKLSPKQKIWEIKILTGQDVEALILIVDTEHKSELEIEMTKEEVISIDGKLVRVIYFNDNPNFSGAIKSQFIAILREKSLQHVIMEYADD